VILVGVLDVDLDALNKGSNLSVVFTHRCIWYMLTGLIFQFTHFIAESQGLLLEWLAVAVLVGYGVGVCVGYVLTILVWT